MTLSPAIKLDNLQKLVALHETYWNEAARHEPRVISWIVNEWEPWWVDWFKVAWSRVPSEQVPGLLADKAVSLQKLRERAASKGIPIPDLSSAHTQMDAPHLDLTDSVQLNKIANERFWDKTGYKRGHKLSHRDPEDVKMMPLWTSIRRQVAREAAQQAGREAADALMIEGSRRMEDRSSYPFPPSEDPLVAEIDDANVVGLQSPDPWRVMRSAPPAKVMHLPMPYYQRDFIGANAPQPNGAQRTGLLAEIAPVLAPATGGFTAKVELDDRQHLNVSICVDGRCYDTSMDLAPAIAAVMSRIAREHTEMHASMPGASHAPPQISGEMAVNAIDEAVGAAGDAMIGALLDRHVDVVCGSWLTDIGHALGATARKLKTPITIAAVAVATVYGGPVAGAAAGKLAGAITDFHANKLDPKKAAPAKKIIDQAKLKAQTDPAAAQALKAAEKAVAQTTVAYHVKDTVEKAAKGDPAAQAEAQHIEESAKQGDPAAKSAMDIAMDIATEYGQSKLSEWVEKKEKEKEKAKEKAAAKASGWFDSEALYLGAVPDVGMDQYRKAAVDTVKRAYHKRRTISALGYLRHNGHHKVYFFNTPEEAQGWYTALRPGYSYAALFDARNLAVPIIENSGGAGEAGIPDPRVTTPPFQVGPPDPRVTTPPFTKYQPKYQLKDQRKEVGAWWDEIIGADAFEGLPNFAMDQHRRAAIDAVKRAHQQRPAPLLGYRRAGNKQSVYFFKSLRDATAWYQHPVSGYSYAAFFDANDMSSPLAEEFSKVFFAAHPASLSGEIGAAIDPDLLRAMTSDQFLTFIDEETDRRYATQTGYTGTRPDRHDPQTARLVPGWMNVRFQVVREIAAEREGQVTHRTTHAGSEMIGAAVGEMPWLDIVGAEQTRSALDAMHAHARSHAAGNPASVVGVVHASDGSWITVPFKSLDDAVDWLAGVKHDQSAFTYAAILEKGSTGPAIQDFEIGQGHTRRQESTGPTMHRGVATISGDDDIIGAAIDTLRKQATDLAAATNGGVIGVVRSADGDWSAHSFRSVDDADDWFGIAKYDPTAFTYAAYFEKGSTGPAIMNEEIGQGNTPRHHAPTGPSMHRGIATTQGEFAA